METIAPDHVPAVVTMEAAMDVIAVFTSVLILAF
jgi:hypothetical protein